MVWERLSIECLVQTSLVDSRIQRAVLPPFQSRFVDLKWTIQLVADSCPTTSNQHCLWTIRRFAHLWLRVHYWWPLLFFPLAAVASYLPLIISESMSLCRLHPLLVCLSRLLHEVVLREPWLMLERPVCFLAETDTSYCPNHGGLTHMRNTRGTVQ